MESKDCEKKLIQISRTAKENIESLVNKLTSAKIDNSEFLIQQQNQMRQQEKYALLVNELAATKLANSKLLVTQQIQMRQQEAVDRFRLIQNKQLPSKPVQNVTTPIPDSNKVVQFDKLWVTNNSPMTIPIAKETVPSIPFAMPVPTAPSFPLKMVPQNILTDYVKKFVDILAKSILLQGIIIDTIFSDKDDRVNATKLIGLEYVCKKIADILDHETVRDIIDEPNEGAQVNILLNRLLFNEETKKAVRDILKECTDECLPHAKYECSRSSLDAPICKPESTSTVLVTNNKKHQLNAPYYSEYNHKQAEEYFKTKPNENTKVTTFILNDQPFPQELKYNTDKKTYLWKEKVANDEIQEALMYFKAYELNLDKLKDEYTNDASYKQLLSELQKNVFIYKKCLKAQLEDITESEKYFNLGIVNYGEVEKEFRKSGAGGKLFSYFTKLEVSSKLTDGDKKTLKKIILHKFDLEKIKTNQEKNKQEASIKPSYDVVKYKKAHTFLDLLKKKYDDDKIYDDQMLILTNMYSTELQKLTDGKEGIEIFLYDKIHNTVKAEAITKILDESFIKGKVDAYFAKHPTGEVWWMFNRTSDDIVYKKLLDNYENSPFIKALDIVNPTLTKDVKDEYTRYIVYKLDMRDEKLYA